MTTTQHFQILPDYFTSPQECERNKENTNPRYKYFNQTHFTAGDVEQFEQYRDKTNGSFDNIHYPNTFSKLTLPIPEWIKYKNLNPLSVDNTFNYIFHKFKKGIFVKIKDGELGVFLPFSKKNFVNEWSHLVKINPNINNPKNLNKFIDGWYANNCLVRCEYPVHEGDTGVPMMSDMLKTLCRERKVCDIEFFVNRRDFPIIKNNDTEPYDYLFGDNHPLVSHNYTTYSPILSMVTTSQHSDIPIPTNDDWARVCRNEGKYFRKTEKRSYEMKGCDWDQKKPIAVFRGASTGAGVTLITNPRLKVAHLSATTPPDVDGLPLLDAGITEWNTRFRKTKESPYLQTIDVKSLPFSTVSRLTPTEQADYKYLINIDGHVSAFRLGLELNSGCCVLLVVSKYKIWFRHLLKPFIHYVPVNGDLSDLIDKIKWCKANDDKCREIAQNATKFAQKYLTKDGILDYLQELLFRLKNMNGYYFYNEKSITEIIRDREIYKLNIYNSIHTIVESKIQYRRDYGTFKALERTLCLNDNLPRKTLFNNSNTEIKKVYMGEFCIVEKTSVKDLVHEAFVSLYGTNLLLKQIPNFAYTFGFKNNTLVTEFIHGMTLFEYINSSSFSVSEYIFILLQIALALHCAQKKCMFVHYDLTPWNIMLQRTSRPVLFDYMIDGFNIYRVKTSVIPVIIDMNNSHIVYENIHYGRVKPFSFSTIQDILSLLSTSIYGIAKTTNVLNNNDVNDIIKVSNFICNTKYKQRVFIQSGSDGLSDIRYFFGKTKKYSDLIYSEKYDLENKTPLDFVHYILKHFKPKMIEKVDEFVHHLNYTDPDRLLGLETNICINNIGDLYERTKDKDLESKILDLPDPILIDNQIELDVDIFNNPDEILKLIKEHDYVHSEFIDDVFIEKYFPNYSMDYKTKKYLCGIKTLYVMSREVAVNNLKIHTGKETVFNQIINLKRCVHLQNEFQDKDCIKTQQESR
jgi:hypothetical protein